MSLFYKWLSCALFVFFTPFTWGMTLHGVIEGTDLRWNNGITLGGYVTLSNWKSMSNLEPTHQWAPGTFLAVTSDKMTLQGPTNEVEIDFQVAGIEYGLGQAAERFTERGAGVLGAKCDVSIQQGSTAKVIGNNCSANESYKTVGSGERFTPFQFIRPIISVDEQELVQSLADAGSIAGTYTGMTTVQPMYYFKSATGTWTYRYAQSVPVILQIVYNPAGLESLEVQGSGVIEPDYDTLNQQVSGEAYFDVVAKGSLANGIKLTLDEIDYELEHEDAGIEPIPYSISCVGSCEFNQLVTSGKLNHKETIVSGGDTEVSFQLRVHYDNLQANDVETGTYRDEFTIYLEEAL